MDDFQRMMDMEGVRRLDEPRPVARKPQRPTARPDVKPEPIATPQTVPTGYAWVTGPRARQALETAMTRVLDETRAGKPSWATGIRQDGTTTSLTATAGAASLMMTADRMSLRIIIVGGDGWTFVLHPQMGVATLDRDPKDDA